MNYLNPEAPVLTETPVHNPTVFRDTRLQELKQTRKGSHGYGLFEEFKKQPQKTEEQHIKMII